MYTTIHGFWIYTRDNNFDLHYRRKGNMASRSTSPASWSSWIGNWKSCFCSKGSSKAVNKYQLYELKHTSSVNSQCSWIFAAVLTFSPVYYVFSFSKAIVFLNMYQWFIFLNFHQYCVFFLLRPNVCCLFKKYWVFYYDI